MKTDENGFALCPKCNYPMMYLDYFDEEHQSKTYVVHWNVKCPTCHEYAIIKETYTLTNIEKENKEWD